MKKTKVKAKAKKATLPPVAEVEAGTEPALGARWICQTFTLGDKTQIVEVPETIVTLKGFMLKQQELLGQLQSDFGFWMRAVLAKGQAEREKGA